MRLTFLDREQELARLRAMLRTSESSLAVVFGRRRLGKSRLVQEALRGHRAVYYVGDERDGALQREAVAREAAALIPGFGDVTYPDWHALLDRFWRDAPAGTALALDDFPALASSSRDLPSVLQKLVDRQGGPAHHLILSGSSQRMMQGLVLDSSAPLFGRAREIMRLGPLPLPWLGKALSVRDPAVMVDHWAAWGGIPRYWELANEHSDVFDALRYLVLDPLGVLHREPERLLRDDLDEVARAASLLALVGRGVHRVSEMGSRLGIPPTSLSRPLQRLVDLGFLVRDMPWGRSERDTKRTWYRIADPFLRLWYRFVEPNRSRLEAGLVDVVLRDLRKRWSEHLGGVWEDLVRASIPGLKLGGLRWGPASRWWGTDTAGEPLEIDLVASSVDDPKVVLAGEVKLSADALTSRRVHHSLAERVARCPDLQRRRVRTAVWVLNGPRPARAELLGVRDVLSAFEG